MRNLKNLKTQVEIVLEKSEKARDSDTYGICQLWLTFYPEKVRKDETGKPFVYLSDMVDLPKEDQFKRYRAFFNSKKGGYKYLSTNPEVLERRQAAESKYKETLN